MRALLALAVLATAFSGCLSQSQPLDPNSPAGDALSTVEPVLAAWDGRITASPLGLLAHSRETETLVAEVQREGFVYEVTEIPQVMEVELSWEGSGNFLSMVSSPSVDGKGVEYFSDFVTESPICIRIPTEGLMAGKWQVMAHTQDTMDVAFTFTVKTVGGAGSILEGEPHSSAEATETTEGASESCTLDAPAEA